MKHRISPTIDCVYKAILGAEENKNLLLDFLNAVLAPPFPISDVEILNPYNEREFYSDKLTIVDVKARDEQGTTYQIEIQLAVFSYLPERMLYTWSDIYQSQLQSGEPFSELRPVISIWMLTENLFPQSPACHHHFQIVDQENQIRLSDQCSIHLLELGKWQYSEALNSEGQWLYFFKEAENWRELPEIINTPEMRQAMAVLERFSEKEADYHLYQARQNAIREEKTRQKLLEEALRREEEAVQDKEEALRREEEAVQDKEEALRREEGAVQDKEEAVQDKEEALRRKEEAEAKEKHLREILKKAGIDPDV